MLETTELIYYKILYVIWLTIIQYADSFEFDAPYDLMDMYSEILHIGGWSIIHVELDAYMEEGEYNIAEIRETLRKYMTIVLLPESEIPPYSNGEEIIESLHLHSVRHDEKKGSINLDFLYINNEEAFRLYKEDIKHDHRNI